MGSPAITGAPDGGRAPNRLIHRHTSVTIMLSHCIPPVIVAGMLGYSISILLTTYAYFIPTIQDQAAQLMNDIFTPLPIYIDIAVPDFLLKSYCSPKMTL